jgi:taurine dioxygenase
MLTIDPTGAVLGATVRGIDLAQPLSERDFGQILLALGRHSVLRFPDQHPVAICSTIIERYSRRR